MIDPRAKYNCPGCGQRLVYVRTDGDMHYFRCLRDGVIVWREGEDVPKIRPQ